MIPMVLPFKKAIKILAYLTGAETGQFMTSLMAVFLLLFLNMGGFDLLNAGYI